MTETILCQQEPNAEEFEDKDWTFVIENVRLLHVFQPLHINVTKL